MNAGAHSAWVETKDQVNVGDTQEVYSLYGHLNDPSGITAPNAIGTYLLTPDGQKLDLAMEQGDYLPGFGIINYAYTDVTYYWPGDYVLMVSKTPTVYDPSWHAGGESAPRLGYSFSKAVIHAGDVSSDSWNCDTPLEMNPTVVPYNISANDNVTFQVTYDGQPVNVTYSAATAFPGVSDTQSGSSGDSGSFVVNFAKGGLWLVTANYDVAEPGTWTATTVSAGHYNIGDQVPYNTVRYSAIMSIYVRK